MEGQGKSSLKGEGFFAARLWQTRLGMAQQLLCSLRKRDAREVEAFDVVIRAYGSVLAASKTSRQQLVQEQAKASGLEQTRDALTLEVQKMQDEGGQVVDTAKIKLFEAQIAELQKERGDLYQKQAEQSNRMLEMNAAVDDAEEKTQKYKRDTDKLQEKIEQKNQEITELNQTIDSVNLQSAVWQQKSAQVDHTACLFYSVPGTLRAGCVFQQPASQYCICCFRNSQQQPVSDGF